MSRVLVVAPHPDDEAIGCAGTIRSHIESGDRVRVVFLTSGEAGDPDRSPADVAAIREYEARAASTILGVQETEFWCLPDGRLRASRSLVERLRHEFAQWGAQEVYVPHSREMHADHRAAARAVRSAALGLNGGGPTVWMFEVWTPLDRMDRIVDITPFIDRKLAAIRAYASQCARVRFDEGMLGLARYRGELHSWPGGEYAEIFLRMAP